MKPLKIIALIVISFGFIMQGCSNESKKVRVGYLPMVSSLTHFVAESQGYYKEEGLEIEANPIKTSDLIAQDLVTGHTDVAIEVSIVPLLRHNELVPNSIKIFSSSSITSENGFDGIVVRNESSYQELMDLSGKKIGVFPGSTAKNSLKEIFTKKYPGLVLPVFVVIDPELHILALQNNDVDALFAYEPALTTGMVKNKFKKISTSIYAIQYPSNPIGVAAANSRWISENQNVAKSFIRAIDKAVQFIRNNPKEARKILAKATGMDNEVAEKINIMPMSLSTDLDQKHLQGYLQLLKNINEINVVPNANSLLYK